MVVRVFEAVQRALPTADIVVAVDHDRVLQAVTAHGIPTTMTRTSHESGTDRAAEVASRLNWSKDDIICNVQGDEPLVPEDMLRAFAEFCSSRQPFSMATIAAPCFSSREVHASSVVKLTVDRDGDAISFSRAPIPFNRDMPPKEWPPSDYLRHVGIYAYRNEVLQMLTQVAPCSIERIEKLEQLRALWLGVPIHVMRWHSPPPHGVDTPGDVPRVEMLIRESNEY